MEFPIWLALIVAVLFVVILSTLGTRKKGTASYILLPALLTPAERSFYGVLISAVGDSALVFSKVRVADVLKPQKGLDRSNWQRAFNRISSKHFDFVLCN